ncbi:MAG: hypothetical protein LHW64_04065 [Candidatus Cloacimonetes bacterium]|jgi:hypothetical protein|nr:hypothetical protein [Candidatus Cloacimonadota bacterium]MCB5286962.1 hypothetical protein [Candidatus Cloacimonadota bacterium]MCK9185128.1 hypothetical protein [Candidatus Cloacimonadota bacterium]MCK9583627.1 hypothetical protein [Candidatus Cloacimonadota bacterium]MDY0229282.1 hypothetical protein [Candidatus Cloacimonadaceae bacterium]
MLFLKSLLFIVLNLAMGLLVVEFVKWLLFNSRARFIFGKKVWLTPGLIVSKRDWLFNKARFLLHDYLKQAEDSKDKYGYLAKWEKLVHDFIWEKTEFVDAWRFMPAKLKAGIRKKIVDAFTGMASKLLRKTIPRLAEQLRVEHRIDDFDEQFSLDFFRKYYNLYVHKYLIYFFLAINLIIGLENMILYLIIG